MPSPFPGMDPYLEDPRLWPDVHNTMIAYLREDLAPRIAPRYTARLEERLVVVSTTGRSVRPGLALVEQQGGPSGRAPSAAATVEEVVVSVVDEEPVQETYIEIQDRQSDWRVVTVVEVLSPTNKSPGPGREQYLRKQQSVLGAGMSLVEIDLLRAGFHTVALPEEQVRGLGPYHYLVCVRRGWERDRFYVYRRTVRDPLVPVRVPLAEDDTDVFVDLGKALNRCYEVANYALYIDYMRPPPHPLDPQDGDWADQLLRENGMR